MQMAPDKAESGKNSYRIVERIIFSKGKSLYIISPYVSGYYAKMLARVALRKNVYLITTEQTKRTVFGRPGRIAAPGPRPLHGAYVAAIAALAYFLGMYAFALIFIDVFGLWLAMLALHRIAFRGRRPRINVRSVNDSFVHEKIYIGEGIAATGSANLTYAGMHRNIERMEAFSGHDDVARLKRHFDELWKSAE